MAYTYDRSRAASDAKGLSTAAKGLSAAAFSAFLLLASTATSAEAQDCSALKYRLWQKSGVTWYDYGDTVEISAGTEGHLYLHVKGNGPTPYTARAEIGYPSAFGLGGDPHRVKRHVRMRAQDGDDRQVARIRFNADEPGTVRLGYRVDGVKAPGDLRDLGRRCRVGQVAIRVLGRGGNDDRPDRPTTRSASREVVELLYTSLLRRERHGEDSRSFVDQVARQGERAIEDVASSIMTSREFRYEVLDRLQRDRPNRGRELAELREDLLYEIYRDLYGNLEPTRREMDEDLEDLDICLSTDRDSERACERLARNLVTHELFYDRHEPLLDELEDRRGDRRDRRRARGTRGRRF